MLARSVETKLLNLPRNDSKRAKGSGKQFEEAKGL
jgi:hypothetical protein